MKSLLKTLPWLPVSTEWKQSPSLDLLPVWLFLVPLNITAMLTGTVCALCFSHHWTWLFSLLHASPALNLSSHFTVLFQPSEIIKIITIFYILTMSLVYHLNILLFLYFPLSLTDIKWYVCTHMNTYTQIIEIHTHTHTHSLLKLQCGRSHSHAQTHSNTGTLLGHELGKHTPWMTFFLNS